MASANGYRLYQRKPGGVWWVAISAAGIRRSTGTADKTAAQEYAAHLAADYWRTARLGEAPRVMWDAAALDWLQSAQHLRDIEGRKDHIRWLTRHLSGIGLDAITPDIMRALAKTREAEGASAATINRYLASLSRVLHHAHEHGWIAAVPAVPKRREVATRQEWLTAQQAADLLAELPDHLRAMAAFSLSTGLRESNVRLLEWSQVDTARAVAWIYPDQAKAARSISVPLNADALAVLTRQRGQHKRWVFPYDGRPVTKCSNHAWNKARNRAGLPHLRWHDLRHTWASWHVQRGTPLPVLQQLGGWASYSMVLRYAHLSADHTAEWAGNSALPGTFYAHGEVTKEGGKAEETRECLGWLMGLEPTTTGITRRSEDCKTNKIIDLETSMRQKTGTGR